MAFILLKWKADMIKRFSNWIVQRSKGWLTLAGVLIMILFMIFVLPDQASKSLEITGSSSSPDTSFFYTPSDLYQIAEEYGISGRQAYIRSRWTFDLIFPLVYVLFLATGISWLYTSLSTQDTRWGLSNLLPILGGIFDYLENVATSFVMAIYPDKIITLAVAAAGFTLLKWILISLAFLAYLILFFWAIINWIQRRG